jgi:D-arabinose 1-dehydrogenase-like Zn-dependent alcohol dehydrogenase
MIIQMQGVAITTTDDANYGTITNYNNTGKFELRELPDPEPAAGEVVVQVQACGLNRLDLWAEEGALPIPLQLPRTTGCEIAGRIVSVGADTTQWRIGDRVAIQSNLFCGQCEFCSRGEESMCLNSQTLGVNPALDSLRKCSWPRISSCSYRTMSV